MGTPESETAAATGRYDGGTSSLETSLPSPGPGIPLPLPQPPQVASASAPPLIHQISSESHPPPVPSLRPSQSPTLSLLLSPRVDLTLSHSSSGLLASQPPPSPMSPHSYNLQRLSHSPPGLAFPALPLTTSFASDDLPFLLGSARALVIGSAACLTLLVVVFIPTFMHGRLGVGSRSSKRVKEGMLSLLKRRADQLRWQLQQHAGVRPSVGWMPLRAALDSVSVAHAEAESGQIATLQY